VRKHKIVLLNCLKIKTSKNAFLFFDAFVFISWGCNDTQIKSLNDSIHIVSYNPNPPKYLDTTQNFARKAFALSVNRPSDRALVLKNIGLIHYFCSAYDSVLIYYKQSLALYQSCNELSGQSKVLNMGIIQMELGNYFLTHETYQQALTIAHQFGVYLLVGMISYAYNNY
jgi:tetratricopeptide (TPR) repeat protein